MSRLDSYILLFAYPRMSGTICLARVSYSRSQQHAARMGNRELLKCICKLKFKSKITTC